MRTRIVPDIWLFIFALSATLIGLLFIFDAGYARSIQESGSMIPAEFTTQIRLLVVALAGYALCRYVSIDFLKRSSGWLWLLTLVGLALVDLIGKSQNEAKRWIAIGSVTIQPSEFAKLTLVLFVAAVLADKKDWNPARRRRSFALWVDNIFTPQLKRWVPGLLVVLGVGFVELGKDLGTAGVLFAIFIAMCATGGIGRRSWATIGVVVLIFLPALFMKQAYRMERLTTHTARWETQNVDDKGFQTTQAERGMADGGLFGVGIGAGQVKHIIPAPTTDYIMATIAEETGLLGSLVVLGAIAGLVWRLLVLAKKATDRFSALTFYGIASWIGIQTAVNVMMANATLPSIGIPIPFISSGGSSLVALWMAIGVAQRLAAAPVLAPQEDENANRNHRRWNRRPHLSGA